MSHDRHPKSHDNHAPRTDAFTSDGLFYVVACVVGLLILSVIVSVTICYVYRKKRESWDVRVQNGSYSDRNDEAISAGANGEMIREVAEGDDRSEFDFDAVTDSVEEKVMTITGCH